MVHWSLLGGATDWGQGRAAQHPFRLVRPEKDDNSKHVRRAPVVVVLFRSGTGNVSLHIQ